MSTENMRNYAVRIGEKLFYTFEEANNASVDGDTITLLRDLVFSGETVLKDGVTLLVPPDITLHTGSSYIIGGHIVAEAAIDRPAGGWTYYGSFTHALENANEKGDDLYTYNNITLQPGTNIVIPYGLTMRLMTYSHLRVDGDMTVNGSVIYASEPCDITVNGKLDIEGEVITTVSSLLFSNGEINLIGGKLRLGGMLEGTTKINAAIELLSRHTKSDTFTMLSGYYSRLNDVLDDLDDAEYYEVNARESVSGFDSLTVPVNGKLNIPAGCTLNLDVDASLNIDGELHIADQDALTGSTEASITIGDKAVLSGNGYTNFYRDGKQVKPNPGECYQWGLVISEDPLVEAWGLSE